MEKIGPKIDDSWGKMLSEEFNKEYFLNLKSFLAEEKIKHIIYPPDPNIFHAFNYTPFEKVKIVILGQDPYHGQGQSHGLCFSVPFGIKPPPSLVNIFKEIKSDLDLPFPNHGNLEHWARQGVLLINATLTVRSNQAESHQGKGWETFTDNVIKKLSDEREGIIFLLWGRFAQNKAELIDRDKHTILEAPHPSPFSARTGFFGCKHFSKCNEILKKSGVPEIDWRVPDLL